MHPFEDCKSDSQRARIWLGAGHEKEIRISTDTRTASQHKFVARIGESAGQYSIDAATTPVLLSQTRPNTEQTHYLIQ